MCRDPGGTPEWLGSVILAGVISIFICLTLVYLLSYIHLSGMHISYGTDNFVGDNQH